MTYPVVTRAQISRRQISHRLAEINPQDRLSQKLAQLWLSCVFGVAPEELIRSIALYSHAVRLGVIPITASPASFMIADMAGRILKQQIDVVVVLPKVLQ